MTYSQDTETNIIIAATDIFLDKGKDGARMQDIADRAGINKALLHYYFRSKNGLYEKVFESIVRHFFRNLLESITDIQDIRLLLQTFINTYIDALAARPKIVRFVIWEIERGGESFARAAKQAFADMGYDTIPLICKFRTAAEKGEIRAVDPVHLTISVLGMCLYPLVAYPIIERIIPGVKVHSAPFLNQRKTEIFNLVWNAIRTEVPGNAATPQPNQGK